MIFSSYLNSSARLRGKGGGTRHQRGPLFHRPQGGCNGFIQTGAFNNLKAPTTPSEPCEPFAPSEPSRPLGRVLPMAKPPGRKSWGFCSSLSLRGKGPGLYPQITVLRLSNHPAWRDEGGVMNEVKPFSGLPWPGVRGGILPPVSFQP